LTASALKGGEYPMSLIKYLAACAALAALCTLSLVHPAAAQSSSGQSASKSQKQLDIAAARADRKTIVDANMKLTESEATTFWPLYEAYEASMDKLDDRHAAEIKAYAEHYQTLTDEDAKNKLDEVIAIEQARLDVQTQYVSKFRSAISSIKTTRFFQIDNKLRAMIQCDIARIVPLARPGRMTAQE
jgi:septum formation topological specificity factor MinE